MGDFLAVLFCIVIAGVIGTATVAGCIRIFRYIAKVDQWHSQRNRY